MVNKTKLYSWFLGGSGGDGTTLITLEWDDSIELLWDDGTELDWDA